MKNIENILFDLDGTLIESSEGITNSILYALDKMKIREDDPAALKSFIGPPLINSFAERYRLDPQRAALAVQLYRVYFSEHGIYENEVYDGIPELLESLNDKKFNLFIATSKPTVYSIKILKYHELDHFFTDIVGASLDHTLLHKKDIIGHLLARHNLRGSHSIMIGDRKHDIIGATKNDIKSIFVTYGHGSVAEIAGLKPVAIVNTPYELVKLF